jgi:hypothetical protein
MPHFLSTIRSTMVPVLTSITEECLSAANERDPSRIPSALLTAEVVRVIVEGY